MCHKVIQINFSKQTKWNYPPLNISIFCFASCLISDRDLHSVAAQLDVHHINHHPFMHVRPLLWPQPRSHVLGPDRAQVAAAMAL